MSGEGEPAARGDRPSRARADDRVEPIYRCLPPGPHKLDPREIALHQRARIHGAMVEAVARDGYDGITVRQVIGLAGVSRRSFYEHFANRHECFLKTARTIAEQELAIAREACRAQEGPPGSALDAAIAAIVSRAGEHPAAFRLLLVDSLAAGDTGAALLAGALSSCEEMLAAALARDPGRTLPTPVLRALAGALNGMLSATLRAPGEHDDGALAAEMTAFALALRAPRHEGAATALASSLRARVRRAAVSAARGPGTEAEPRQERERMLLSALRLAARQPVARLSLPQIADQAAVSIDLLMAAFPAAEDCLQEALARSGDELLEIAIRAQETAADWPQATRLSLAAMLAHLAGNPARARALALVAHRAGPAARRGAEELDAALGTVLTSRAGEGGLPAEAAAGAFWHTVRSALLEGRAPVLPACSDHVAYTLLAPAIGSNAAIAALGGGR